MKKDTINTELKYAVRVRNGYDKGGGAADVFYTDSLTAAKRFRTKLVGLLPMMVDVYILDQDLNCISYSSGAAS